MRAAAVLVPATAAAPEAWPRQPIHSRIMPMAVIGELCAPGAAWRVPPTAAAATSAETPAATYVAREPAAALLCFVEGYVLAVGRDCGEAGTSSR